MVLAEGHQSTLVDCRMTISAAGRLNQMRIEIETMTFNPAHHVGNQSPSKTDEAKDESAENMVPEQEELDADEAEDVIDRINALIEDAQSKPH